MQRERRSWLLCLAIGVWVALAGCSAEVQTGSTQAVVTLPQTLSASDVARVELTVTGAGMATRTDLLVKTGGQWGGILGNLPAGGGRTFRAQAFDATNTVRYAGQATDVTITAGQTTAVTLLLQEVNAPPAFENAAPVITSLVASPATVAPGGMVALQATAQDPDSGDTLTYAWTAQAGSFSSASNLNTAWTAPAQPGPVVLTLTVTDSKGATAALSVTITVGTGVGSAAVNVSVNTWPQVARVTATPSFMAVGETTTVVANASDNDGDSLTYAWTAGCRGTWANATSANASFTPMEQPPAGGLCASCPLTVTVTDGRGGQTTGTLAVCVGPKTSPRFPPEVVESFQSLGNVPAPGDTVTFRVKAKDAQDSALSFAWAANVGTLGMATHSATTSEVVWTAPSCVPSDTPPRVTVTVTNALGLSASTSFALTGGTACIPSPGLSISVGFEHTVALKADGTVWSWGVNANGRLGEGTDISHRTTPVRVQGLTGVAAIAAGDEHTLALKADGTVWAWSRNDTGQLGDGTLTLRRTPVRVQGLTGVETVVAGGYHSLALKADGTLWAWGWNSNGNLGDGTTIDRTIPVRVQGLTGVATLIAGNTHTLALKADGTVWAWGDNNVGQLGDPTAVPRKTPVQVQGLTGVAAIAAGTFHSLALKADGTLWAWGLNTHGALGDGTTSVRYTPVQVQGLTGVVAIAAGYEHTLALKADGTVWAWGGNTRGQLGDGTLTQHTTPVQVQGLTGVQTLSAGGFLSMALKADGTLWAWGWNRYGSVGDGTTIDRTTPVQVQGLGN
ncbi:kelch-like protein [Corallococcus sp. AB049A]|uniref:RCC1 domain-containing protein n=1 Tax=Corallococcus sp. AB049A TaxID=2316721 RepID=UPI000EBC884C|nr:PKD domain-containing protein [Corallococcus sp. AB049A]RKI72889.1 kelch-like protein [Corallococcus sp. AB049A]